MMTAYKRDIKARSIRPLTIESRLDRVERLLASARRENRTLYHRVYASTRRRRALQKRMMRRLYEMRHNVESFNRTAMRVNCLFMSLNKKQKRSGQRASYVALTVSEWQTLRMLLRRDWRRKNP